MTKAKESDKDDRMLRQGDKRNDDKEVKMSGTKRLATLVEVLGSARGI